MPQPRNSINEVIVAAGVNAVPEGSEDQAAANLRHCRATLETAIETLLACEAVQAALETRLIEAEERIGGLSQAVINKLAEIAVLKRQLAVAKRAHAIEAPHWTPENFPRKFVKKPRTGK